MRIALAQLNPTVGDLHGNAELVLRAACAAQAAGAQLLVTSELMLTGYPPQDLLFHPRFLLAQLDQLDRLIPLLPLPTLLGCVCSAVPTASPFDDELWRVTSEADQPISNSAVFISGGRVQAVARKALLPTYDVFDEWRYFRPGDPALIELDGLRLGVTICEDIWDEGYARQPVHELAEAGAQAIINLSASPFHSGHPAARLAVLRRQVERHGLPLIYCNMVGGQDELVFDGRSMVVAGDGTLLAQAKAWEEELLLVELPVGTRLAASVKLAETETLIAAPGRGLSGSDNSGSRAGTPAPLKGASSVPAGEEADLFNALVLGLRDYARKCGFSSVVLGLSGGIDSALVACIAARALGPQNVTAFAMPSRHTAGMSNEDAALLAGRLGIALHSLPIEESVALAQARFETELGPYRSGLTRENLQSRERGKTLMEFSNDRSALLLATGNKTEYALGYSTLYGDMCGGLAVIGDLNKLEVYALARWFNAQAGSDIIPQRTIERAPSAELEAQQVDPFDYEVIAPLTDLVIAEHWSVEQLVGRGYAEEDVRRVLRLVRLNEYKRKQAPPIIRVSAKAFGIGRRMPIVNAFE